MGTFRNALVEYSDSGIIGGNSVPTGYFLIDGRRYTGASATSCGTPAFLTPSGNAGTTRLAGQAMYQYVAVNMIDSAIGASAPFTNAEKTLSVQAGLPQSSAGVGGYSGSIFNIASEYLFQLVSSGCGSAL